MELRKFPQDFMQRNAKRIFSAIAYGKNAAKPNA